MRLSSSAYATYQRAHRLLQDAAKKELGDFVASLPYGLDDPRALRPVQAEVLRLLGKYGSADASLSAAFYDELMDAMGANTPAAIAAAPEGSYALQDVSDAIGRATSSESAQALIEGVLAGHVKRAGIATMRSNAVRDRVEWAWICTGDTCAFCRTLASRGWQPASKAVRAGRHAEHIHDNCDCQFVVRKPGETLDVEGYDADEYKRQYEAANGDINAMRRADYTPEYAAQRNARRRELYKAAHDIQIDE